MLILVSYSVKKFSQFKSFLETEKKVGMNRGRKESIKMDRKKGLLIFD